MKKPSKGLLLPKRIWLKAEDFEYICFNLAVELLGKYEPIPNYETRDIALLESALGSPQQTYGKRFLYPTLIRQASILFYSLIKNHPFRNGNKRISVMALLVFLSLNNKWIDTNPATLYLIACDVSKSNSKEKDQILNEVEKFIKKYLINKTF